MPEVWFVWISCHVVKPLRVLAHQNCYWNIPSKERTTTHKSENTGNNRNTWMGSSAPHTIQPRSWCLRFPPFWSPQRRNPWEKFGSEDEVLEEPAAASKFQLVQEGDRCSCLSVTQDCWSWRLCRKIRCSIRPSSYPMSTFKELYNKLLALN